MFQPSKPPIPQNQIPTVKKICQDLGFGFSYDRQEHHLKEASQAWRRQYVTHDAIPGKDLRKWKEAKTQKDLTTMAKDFLEKGGYGKKLWPAGWSSPSKRLPEYPRDKDR